MEQTKRLSPNNYIHSDIYAYMPWYISTATNIYLWCYDISQLKGILL